MNTSNPFDDPLDRILAEIAIRVQLPPSKYQLACDRYAAVAAYAERDGSPLKGKIARFYPQGSMAIGATIAARGKDEEYDIDIVAELMFLPGADPTAVLNALFHAIRGEPNSRYYEMVERRTRCVTVYYEDGMHMDITPAILRAERLARTSDIFHNDPDEPQEPADTLLMNAWGFSQLFKERTADSTTFADAYARRSRANDIRADAEAEEVDPQEDPARKSSDVVALQLIKRNRNTRYADRDASMPPSILLSKYVSDVAQPVESLSQALMLHVENIRRQLVRAESRGRLVYAENPTCPEDCFTDRWPSSRADQRQYIVDLGELLVAMHDLRDSDKSIRDIQDSLVGLFGDYPTKAAVRAVQSHIGSATRAASTGHKIGGGLSVSAAAAARSAPASTNMGGALPTQCDR